MTSYIVGLRHKAGSRVLTIEAEDALIAALKAKHENPEAVITYVRKSNRRGDYRHPHEGLLDSKMMMSAFSPKADMCGATRHVR